MKESNFKLDPIQVSAETSMDMGEVRKAAIALYDEIAFIQRRTTMNNISYKIAEEQSRCFAIAKTKIQEALFWANRAMSFADCDIQNCLGGIE